MLRARSRSALIVCGAANQGFPPVCTATWAVDSTDHLNGPAMNDSSARSSIEAGASWRSIQAAAPIWVISSTISGDGAWAARRARCQAGVVFSVSLGASGLVAVRVAAGGAAR